MIVESKNQKIRNLLVCSVFVILLAIDFLFLYPQNQIASIVFGTMLLILILGLPENRIIIEADHIEFQSHRIFGFYKSIKRLDFSNILSADFYPEKTNWLIILLAGAGGHSFAELTFILKNSERFSRQIKESDDFIKTLTSELGKRIQLKINK
ncbi:hypothetical protein [Geofilum rhodophaeum]|uniref:hypothetical protein n=1 Tax=Geofilum rhodophaeum TaxID=1965019 RepID=UPI000B526B78|nr:hypothetical protein [Geofilum rhodophaeum]